VFPYSPQCGACKVLHSTFSSQYDSCMKKHTFIKGVVA
jgi:hypothetical protein